MRREDVEGDETIGAARAAGAANGAALGRGSARAGDIKDEAAGLAPKLVGSAKSIVTRSPVCCFPSG